MATIAIEAIGAAHARVMAAIHAQAFARGWTAQAFADLLALPGTGALLGSTPPGDPAGLALYRFAGGEAEVLTIAVRPDRRRRGVARALLAATREALPPSVGEVFIEVAETNDAGRALYGALGFETVGRRAGYYLAGGEPGDALVMRMSLS